MDERILKWLFYIQVPIKEIDVFFTQKPKEFSHYQSDVMLKRAIERNLEIIGEAINRIIKKNPTFPIEHAKRIVGLRNQIIHSYDSISDENIWAILSKHIPLLKEEVDALIKNAD